MAVYGYCRVSTLAQADGESLDVQTRKIQGHAMANDMTLAKVFIERGVSGSKPLADRPEGAALLAALQPGDTIITTRLDRMFRSSLDALDSLAKLKAQSVALHMMDLGGDVTSNGISKLVFTILSAVAEAERERIRERIGGAKADSKARGMYLGGKVPLGFRVADDGRLVADEAQSAAIAMAKELKSAGLPIRAVQERVAAELGVNLSIGAIYNVTNKRRMAAKESSS